jgi:hypothetical protein
MVMSGDINWNKRPHEVIAAAKSRALAALHHKHSKGLTTLERAYLHALKTGRVDPDD